MFWKRSTAPRPIENEDLKEKAKECLKVGQGLILDVLTQKILIKQSKTLAPAFIRHFLKQTDELEGFYKNLIDGKALWEQGKCKDKQMCKMVANLATAIKMQKDNLAKMSKP